MNLIKVAAAVLNTTPLDWEGNRRAMLGAIAEARRQGVLILCLPEMCICGYECEDAFHSPATARTAWDVLQELLPATRGMVVSFGLPVVHQNGIFNCAALAADGKVLGLVAKRFLAGDGIHYEPRWFKPWPGGVISEITLPVDGSHVGIAIGDVYFDVGGVRIGFEICEDAWVAKRPGGDLALEGIDLILNPSASHFAFGKLETRKRFVIEGSRAFGVTYVYANLLGNEAGRAIYDGGALIASGGKLAAAGPRFTFADYHVTSAVVDIDSTRMSQARTASFTPSVAGGTKDRISAPFNYPSITPELPQTQQPDWELGQHVKEEEFTRAEALGLWDYMRKSRSRGFVVSLSGGADSTAVSCLCAMTFRLAWNELGYEEFYRKLSYLRLSNTKPGDARQPAGVPLPPEFAREGTVQDATRALLLCVYQATRNSGEVTRSAARTVARAIAADWAEFNIEPIVSAYVSIVESQYLCRQLSWDTDDIALQNIQARVRSPGVWMLANIRNALLLATSNRSEAAVGYATMDGDTSGGLSPVAGIDKNFLRHWLVWLEREGPRGLGPIPGVGAVNVQAPTAELRPPEKKQTDEDDLMPYDLLDAVERAAIRDKRTPIEVLQLMRQPFGKHPVRQLATWVERFFTLWCRNQWKRERYAPSFHLDDENLDPKTWCRFPILSGGYERELAEMWQYVEGLTPDSSS